MNVLSLLEGHSKAMYASYFLYKPLGLLFDCGEGMATHFGSRIFAVENLMLTHSHQDHCGGIPNFLFARSGGRGDNAKPLTIYYPKDDRNFLALIKYVESLTSHHRESLSFDLTWVPLEPEQRVDLSHGKYIVPFQTEHEEGRLTFGYRIHEVRRKLKDEYVGLDSDQIVKLIREHGRDHLQRTEEATVFTHSGDTRLLPAEKYGKPQLLMHEATFLDRADVKYDSHSVLGEVLALAREVAPKSLVLYHFSTRYSAAEVSEAVRTKSMEAKLEFDVWVQYGYYLYKAYWPGVEAPVYVPPED